MHERCLREKHAAALKHDVRKRKSALASVSAPHGPLLNFGACQDRNIDNPLTRLQFSIACQL